ncbi:hypothetical protein BDZ91DRAFT_711111 [Kalaharituber pfeilii]|nr:hypothetical protein BDZ91DRAFT_711111 [Kalaharituber pfeilii]
MAKTNSRRRSSPLTQARLTDLNFNFQRVRSRLEATPPADKHRQIGLEAFGFSVARAGPARKPAKPTTADDKPPTKKRKGVRIASPSSSSSLPGPFPSPLGAVTLPHDREIPETQFAQSDLFSEDESDDIELKRREATPPTVSPPTPTSGAIAMGPGPTIMPPPPITPKRRKVLEIPNSHSPPVTPLSPYRSPSKRSLTQSPLSHCKPSLRWRIDGKVASSQWWDNEDSQDPTLAMQVPESQQAEDDEESDDVFETSFHPVRLFQSEISQRSLSELTIPPSSQPVKLERNESLKIKLEDGFEPENLSSITHWTGPDTETRENTVIPESPLVDTGHSPEPSQTRIKLESIETEKFHSPDRKKRGDTAIPESPSGRRFGKIDESTIPPSSQRIMNSAASSDIPSSNDGVLSQGQMPPETQYGDGAEYEWWDINPQWVEEKDGGNLKDAKGTIYHAEGLDSDNLETEKKTEEEVNRSSSDDESEVEVPTISQLLPETLMESFPMPPPLTQWSSMPSWDPGEEDDDEL